MKKVLLSILGLSLMLSCAFADNIQVNVYANGSNRAERFANNNNSGYYDYAPSRRPRLKYRGVYVESTSGVYYSHSKSRLKGARHAARINYYNSMYN